MKGKQRIALAMLLGIGIAPFYLNGFYNSPLAAENISWFWTVEIFTWIVMPIVLFLIGLRCELFTTAELGLTTKVRNRDQLWAFWTLMAVVAFLLWKIDLSANTWAHEALPIGWELPPFRYIMVVPPAGPHSGGYRLLVLAHLSFTAGFVEEFYFRAAMHRLFPPGWITSVAYVVISSIIFAGGHWEGGLQNMFEAFAVGIFAATVFRLTCNLWPLILGHIVTDWYWFNGGTLHG